MEILFGSILICVILSKSKQVESIESNISCPGYCVDTFPFEQKMI